MVLQKTKDKRQKTKDKRQKTKKMNVEKFPVITDTYYFKCTRCGNCCTGDQKVHLNLYDLYKMAAYHKFNNSALLFRSGLVNLIRTKNNVYLPRIRFKVNPFRFCPYLINGENTGLCKLHPQMKPLICSLAPAGRVIDFEDNSETWLFVKPAPDCPGAAVHHKNTLNELKEEFNAELEYQKRFFRLLNTIRFLKWERKDFLDRLYSFSSLRPFDEMLFELERNLL